MKFEEARELAQLLSTRRRIGAGLENLLKREDIATPRSVRAAYEALGTRYAETTHQIAELLERAQ